MQRILEERWGPKRVSPSKANQPDISEHKESNALILAIHKKLQHVCGHRGVGRDRHHTDNRKGPTIEATFLHRQLADAYARASADGYRFPPPPPTRDGKVKGLIRDSQEPWRLTCTVHAPAQAVWRDLEFSCFSQVHFPTPGQAVLCVTGPDGSVGTTACFSTSSACWAGAAEPQSRSVRPPLRARNHPRGLARAGAGMGVQACVRAPLCVVGCVRACVRPCVRASVRPCVRRLILFVRVRARARARLRVHVCARVRLCARVCARVHVCARAFNRHGGDDVLEGAQAAEEADDSEGSHRTEHVELWGGGARLRHVARTRDSDI